MEKFRIAQYGFIQMVALTYGIMGSGLIAKGVKTMMASGGIVPTPYMAVTIFHDYGILLSLVIIAWAVFCAYHSTIFSRRNIDEGTIVASGLSLAILFFMLGTVIIVMSFAAAFGGGSV